MNRLKQKINRQEKILLSLFNLTYATSDQIQIIHSLGTNRNARYILYELEQDCLIKSIYQHRKIYHITNKGCDSIGKHNLKLKQKEITHILMRNDLYIQLNQPITWQKEAKTIINDKSILVSDARFIRNGEIHFVEIDHKQSMKTNTNKIIKYHELFKIIYKQEKHHPKLIWYTLSDTRRKKLEGLCRKYMIRSEFYV